MNRRRLLLMLSAACLLVAVPFVVRWAMAPAPGVTLESFRRLHAGMTYEEVVAIMGKPADSIGPVAYVWNGGDGLVSIANFGVCTGGAYQIAGKSDVLLLAPRQEHFLERIRRWLGL